MSPILRRLLPLAVGLIISEIVVRLMVSQPVVWRTLENRGDVGHRAWHIQSLRHHRPGATDFSPTYPIAFHAQYGWTSRPGQFESEGVLTTVDARGLRLPVSPDPSADSLRVTFFGDSFGFGAEVSDDETYVAQLAERAPHLDLRNLSVIGFAHDQMLLRLQSEGPDHQADIAVLMMVSCDIPRNRQQFTAWAKPVLERHEGSLHAVPERMPTPADVLRTYDRSSRLVDILGAATSQFGDEARQEAIDAHTAEILVAFAEEARAQGAEPWFVHAPILHEPNVDPSTPRWATFGGRSIMRRVCERVDGVCLDLFEVFREAHEEGVPLQTGTHWSRQAHGLIAAAIAEELATRHPGLEEH